jgi:hypothetical protein
MLNRKPVNLNKRWITKPLHKDTFTQVVIGGNSGTMHRLYMLTNEIEQRQEFLELKNHEQITITAVVSIKPGYAKDARSQAEILKWMRKQVAQRPEFTVKLYIYDKSTMVELFNFKHTTTNEKEVYKLMDMLEQRVIDRI